MMSTFPISEALQAPVKWFHLPKRHAINTFPSLYQASCELQEGQLYGPLLPDKTPNAANLTLLLDPQKGKLRLDSELEQCGHTSSGYEAPTDLLTDTQGSDITRPDPSTGLERENLTFQSDVFSSEEQWPGLGHNTFKGTLHPSEPGGDYSDFLTKPAKCGQEQQIGDLLFINNYGDLQLSTEATVDLKGQAYESLDNIHGNTAAPKPVNAAIDKKEMRARRNRESARRSRMKSKQHFQKMEQTFVLMSRENRALLAVMEKLLPNYITRFPHLRGKLQSLFGMGR